MHLATFVASTLLFNTAIAWIPSPITAIQKGFSYGSNTPNFTTSFNAANHLQGTTGFTSARLYTTIAINTTSDPSPAIQAALNAPGTTLLLGMWVSPGTTTNLAAYYAERDAMYKAFKQFPALKQIVVGISVGNEDLYRAYSTANPTGKPLGNGATTDALNMAIKDLRKNLTSIGITNIPIGHVDTWQMWTDSGIGGQIIPNLDFIGMNAFPYWEGYMATNSSDFFYALSSVQNTAKAANNVPVWITETGYPVAGDTINAPGNTTQGIPSPNGAQTYWNLVACPLLKQATTNLWYYTLSDTGSYPTFGLTNATDGTTPFDLSCTNAAAAAGPTGYKKRQAHQKKTRTYQGGS